MDGKHQVPPLRVYQGVMVMTGYVTCHMSPEVEPRHLMQFSVISRTPVLTGFTPSQRFLVPAGRAVRIVSLILFPDNHEFNPYPRELTL